MPMYLQAPFRLFLAGIATSISIVSATAAADLTTVKIEGGAVHGVAATGVIGFKGIPYAAPPHRRPTLARASAGRAVGGPA